MSGDNGNQEAISSSERTTLALLMQTAQQVQQQMMAAQAMVVDYQTKLRTLYSMGETDELNLATGEIKRAIEKEKTKI